MALTTAIGRRLYDLREAGQMPVAIVMDPEMAKVYRAWGIGGWTYGRPELFNLPVEIDGSAEGLSVRISAS